ncbi:hypothetical protein [Streptomyces flaveus]|uniref:hypothetical protein n=1 Tax=Streptomyces flaveus TaxID=66370 RepID=UPI00332406C3
MINEPSAKINQRAAGLNQADSTHPSSAAELVFQQAHREHVVPLAIASEHLTQPAFVDEADLLVDVVSGVVFGDDGQ